MSSDAPRLILLVKRQIGNTVPSAEAKSIATETMAKKG
jgi:hypothetical protein